MIIEFNDFMNKNEAKNHIAQKRKYENENENS